MKIAALVVLSFFLVVLGLAPSASAARFDFDNWKELKADLKQLKSDWKELKSDWKEVKADLKELKSDWKNGIYTNDYIKNGTTYVPNGNSVPAPETFFVFIVGFGLLALWYRRQRSPSGMSV
jgi:hypothetical protein